MSETSKTAEESTLAAEREWRPWDVLLLGGHSGIGKSWLGNTLARRLGAEWRQTDGVRYILQHVITADSAPELHTFWSSSVWQLPADELVERLATIARLVSPALDIVVAQYLDRGVRLVLEGDGLSPAFAAQHVFAGVPVPEGRVKAIFLVESDEQAVLANMLKRGLYISHLPVEQQQVQARTSWLYGQRLRREAEHLGLPVIAPRPWETLDERVIAMLENGHGAGTTTDVARRSHVPRTTAHARQVSIGDLSLLVAPSQEPKFWDMVQGGGWQPGTLAVLDRMLSEGTTYVDCGGWLGSTVLYAASQGAAVTAFECDPVAIAHLQENLSLNPALAQRVTLVEAGLSDRDGSFVLYSDRFGNGESSMFDVVERGGRTVAIRHHVTVPGLEAGRVFADAGWLNDPDALIGIDVEGAENHILASLGSAIDTAACSFFIAFHPFNLVSEDERTDHVLRAKATLAWIDQFWEYVWWSGAGGALRRIDKQHYLELAMAGKPLPAILFSRRDDLGEASTDLTETFMAVETPPIDELQTGIEPESPLGAEVDRLAISRGQARPATSVAALMQRDLSIFIPTFNNPTYLRTMVDQLHARDLTNIIVVDNASTTRKMRALLDSDFGVTVIRLTQNLGPHHIFLDDTNYASLPELFCVTDPDLELNPELPEDFLAQLVSLTERFKIGKAGFSLDISDPASMRDERITIHGVRHTIWDWERQYWTDPIGELAELGTVYRARVDTTFAVYNKTYFRRENHDDAVRVAGVFTCRHLPWYRETGIPATEEETFRATTRFSQNLS